jgi:uncharacterized protein YecE (DUF72 family)
VGTAGWSIPRASSQRCVGDGTHLQRYARIFSCAEINSSFHRPHAATTYARWAASTPVDFRFSVKVPKQITHEQRLVRSRRALETFLAESEGLGARRGPLLVQLPPSLEFEPRVANRFFALVRSLYEGPLVCEPRHQTWFASAGDTLFTRYQVARVAADPRTYWSSYAPAFIDGVATTMRAQAEAWCIFDNTASGAALENAWDLLQRLSP